MWLDKVASSFITKIHNPILSYNITMTQNRVIMIELKQRLILDLNHYLKNKQKNYNVWPFLFIFQ